MFSRCTHCVRFHKLWLIYTVDTYGFVFKCRVMDQDLNRIRESAKAEKSEIETLFSQYQSELDNLITTEKRLREMYAYTYEYVHDDNLRMYVYHCSDVPIDSYMIVHKSTRMSIYCLLKVCVQHLKLQRMFSLT